MGKIIAEFSDGSSLDFDTGKFDSWCVYLSRPNSKRYAPEDYQYFSQLRNFAKEYSPEMISNDFLEIYNATSKKINPEVFEHIKDLARKYNQDSLEIQILFSILYSGMVAEENRQHKRLGKRIKRLGVHQLLFENFTPPKAANFSKGKKWQVLDTECRKRGF